MVSSELLPDSCYVLCFPLSTDHDGFFVALYPCICKKSTRCMVVSSELLPDSCYVLCFPVALIMMVSLWHCIHAYVSMPRLYKNTVIFIIYTIITVMLLSNDFKELMSSLLSS